MGWVPGREPDPLQVELVKALCDEQLLRGKLFFVGDYKPLDSGFNYEKLGVSPRPVSYYR